MKPGTVWRDQDRPLVKMQPQFWCMTQDTGDARTEGQLSRLSIRCRWKAGAYYKRYIWCRAGEVEFPNPLYLEDSARNPMPDTELDDLDLHSWILFLL